jgi:NADH:ubiquinone oxidoreductase subunit 4 (subunit M)
MIALSLIAVIYVGLVAMVQQDMKKLVAYSSVAHMGLSPWASSSSTTSVCPAASCR